MVTVTPFETVVFRIGMLVVWTMEAGSLFMAVIRGEETPLVSGREGLRTLAVVEAIRRSAARGEPAIPEL